MTKCAVCGSKKLLAMHTEPYRTHTTTIKGKTHNFWLCIECHRRVHSGVVSLDKLVEEKEKKPKEIWSVS